MKRMLLIALLVSVGCGPAARNNGDDGPGGDGGLPDAACPTAITGKVYAPNGTLPLYNITVYAPVSDPPPFAPGVSCSQCSGGLPGGSYASAVTDSQGSFRLEGIPPGQNV